MTRKIIFTNLNDRSWVGERGNIK